MSEKEVKKILKDKTIFWKTSGNIYSPDFFPTRGLRSQRFGVKYRDIKKVFEKGDTIVALEPDANFKYKCKKITKRHEFFKKVPQEDWKKYFIDGKAFAWGKGMWLKVDDKLIASMKKGSFMSDKSKEPEEKAADVPKSKKLEGKDGKKWSIGINTKNQKKMWIRKNSD